MVSKERRRRRRRRNDSSQWILDLYSARRYKLGGVDVVVVVVLFECAVNPKAINLFLCCKFSTELLF